MIDGQRRKRRQERDEALRGDDGVVDDRLLPAGAGVLGAPKHEREAPGVRRTALPGVGAFVVELVVAEVQVEDVERAVRPYRGHGRDDAAA